LCLHREVTSQDQHRQKTHSIGFHSDLTTLRARKPGRIHDTASEGAAVQEQSGRVAEDGFLEPRQEGVNATTGAIPGCSKVAPCDRFQKEFERPRGTRHAVMKLQFPTRLTVLAALAVWLAAAPGWACGQRPQPREPQWAARPLPGDRVLLAQNRPVGPRLQQWMESHRNLPPAEQERALENDPSFRALNPQQQRRALNELHRLQGMTPQQRNRRWAILRMTPEQLQQFNAVMQQYAGLPPPRQAMVGQALAALRRVPPPQRQAAMATYPPLRQFSPYERQVLAGLLFWEPYLDASGPSPNQGP
jgi:hypothetical protein